MDLLANINLDPLTIALIVLVLAGVWAVIELALFLRRTRKGVADITDSLNQTIAEFQPTVSKLDGIVDELGSSSKQVEPLLEKASTTVDLVNVNLVRTESVLADVNTATNTAANLSNTVSATANNAAAAVAGAVNKVAGKVQEKVGGKSLEAPVEGEPARLVESAAPVVEQVSGDAGYFTYPGTFTEAPSSAQATIEVPAPSVEVSPEALDAPASSEVTSEEQTPANTKEQTPVSELDSSIPVAKSAIPVAEAVEEVAPVAEAAAEQAAPAAEEAAQVAAPAAEAAAKQAAPAAESAVDAIAAAAIAAARAASHNE